MEDSEWVRLPGLFRWDEICEVFAAEATPDRDWHFIVRVAPSADGPELLYVVHAARRVRRRALERATLASREHD